MAGMIELEREQHNAQIQERYRRILEAEEIQFDTPVQASAQAPAYVSTPTSQAPYVAPIVNNTPVMEQTPVVSEFPSRLENPAFTSQKYDNLEANYTPVIEPVQEVVPVQEVSSVAVEAVESFSLTAKAKMVIGAVCATFVLMFSLVGVNTQIINQKAKQIKNLEKVRKELMEQNDELQLRIQNAQSEESIREYALSHGMIKG